MNIFSKIWNSISIFFGFKQAEKVVQHPEDVTDEFLKTVPPAYEVDEDDAVVVYEEERLPDFTAMDKKQIDEWAAARGIKLDRRLKPEKMVSVLLEALKHKT